MSSNVFQSKARPLYPRESRAMIFYGKVIQNVKIEADSEEEANDKLINDEYEHDYWEWELQ
jgi:hypothetical protein